MAHIEVFENERAEHYDAFIDDWIPGYRDFIANLPTVLQGACNKKLLVVGCGTGNEIERFAAHSADWRITGIDPSPQMLSQAKDKLAKFDNVTLRQGVVADLDMNEQYGVATLLLVLHFMADTGEKLALLSEIAKRLQPNAPFVLLDVMGDKQQIDANAAILYDLLASKGIEKEELDTRIIRMKEQLHGVSEQRLAALLTTAGFKPPVRFFQNTLYMGWLTAKL